MDKIIPIKDVRDKLNSISPSFCAAKWSQVTLHLQTGHTHSCHHPRTHKIPVDGIDTDPSILHNTPYKKSQRKLMLEGVRPTECDYCWRIEDSGADAYSDRSYKSKETWAWPFIDEITKQSWDHNVFPTYVEVSFSNVCNFKCSYCMPQVSSKWMEEIERYGPYPTTHRFGNLDWLKNQDAMPIPQREANPYVSAFWKWWPELYTKLMHFRITGGEPLMDKNTFRVLDYVIEHPNPELEISVNTNLCVQDSLLDTFIEKAKIIVSENKLKRFRVYTSCDAAEKQAGYIRNGMDYTKWLSNIERILSEIPGCTVSIMSTYNALSVFSYNIFLQDLLRLRVQYSTAKRTVINIDVPYLRFPEHQSIFILPKEYTEKIKDSIAFMSENSETKHGYHKGFYTYEIEKFQNVYSVATSSKYSQDMIDIMRKDFIIFVDEHDRRRGTNFLNTFPEMTELYNKWKTI